MVQFKYLFSRQRANHVNETETDELLIPFFGVLFIDIVVFIVLRQEGVTPCCGTVEPVAIQCPFELQRLVWFKSGSRRCAVFMSIKF